MEVTWLGHATASLSDSGTTVLTDPVLVDRLAHLRRRRGPTPRLSTPPDAVVVSHLHADHCDLASLRRLPAHTRLLVPRGAAGFLSSRLGERDITEMRPGDETIVGALRIRAVPANHHAGRLPGSRIRAEAIGYLVSGRRTAWFAGDTGLYDGMAELGPVDLALVPVWGWGWSIGPGHLDPTLAAEATRRAGASWAVPIHWGTLWPIGFARVRPDRFHQPGEEYSRMVARRAPGTRVRVLPPGGSMSVEEARSTP